MLTCAKTGLFKIVLMFVFGILPVAATAAGTPINWVLNGSAQYNNGYRVMITPDAGTQAGSMWNPCQIDMNNSFNMCFIMNFGHRACGADGIAFVLQGVGTGALGPDSGEHGYSGISPSLAIDFDTYQNPGGTLLGSAKSQSEFAPQRQHQL